MFFKEDGAIGIGFLYLKDVLTSFPLSLTSSCCRIPHIDISSEFFEALQSHPFQVISSCTNTGTILIWWGTGVSTSMYILWKALTQDIRSGRSQIRASISIRFLSVEELWRPGTKNRIIHYPKTSKIKTSDNSFCMKLLGKLRNFQTAFFAFIDWNRTEKNFAEAFELEHYLS